MINTASKRLEFELWDIRNQIFYVHYNAIKCREHVDILTYHIKLLTRPLECTKHHIASITRSSPFLRLTGI